MSQALLPQNYKGYFATESALTTAIPNGLAGYWVIVEDTSAIYIWNAGTDAWVNVGEASGGGDVNGPNSSINNSIVLFDGTTGKLIKDSGVLLSALGALNTANTWTKAQRGAIVTLTDAATIAIDLDLANNFRVVLGGSRTLGVPTNPVAGQTGVIDVWQDSTGSRTLSYAWPYVFPGGAAPTLTTTKFTSDELYYYVRSYSTSTVTITIATPGVVTWNNHGLNSGQRIRFTTTGALPTGLDTTSTYFVNVIDANTFSLASSKANLDAGTLIQTTGTQSGVQTAINMSIVISSNLNISA